MVDQGKSCLKVPIQRFNDIVRQGSDPEDQRLDKVVVVVSQDEWVDPSDKFILVTKNSSSFVPFNNPDVARSMQRAKAQCKNRQEREDDRIKIPDPFGGPDHSNQPGHLETTDCSKIPVSIFNQLDGPWIHAVVVSADQWVDENDKFVFVDKYGLSRYVGYPSREVEAALHSAVTLECFKPLMQHYDGLQRAAKMKQERERYPAETSCRKMFVDDFNRLGAKVGIHVESSDEWVDKGDQFVKDESDETFRLLKFDDPTIAGIMKTYSSSCKDIQRVRRKIEAAFGITFGPPEERCEYMHGELLGVYKDGKHIFTTSSKEWVRSRLDFGIKEELGGRYFTERQLVKDLASYLRVEVPVQYRPQLSISPDALSFFAENDIVLDERNELIVIARTLIDNDGSIEEVMRNAIDYGGSLDECGFNVIVDVSIDRKTNLIYFKAIKEDGTETLTAYDVTTGGEVIVVSAIEPHPQQDLREDPFY
ncbi:MAG: hypothetical protein WC956_04395 [bacterium]